MAKPPLERPQSRPECSSPHSELLGDPVQGSSTVKKSKGLGACFADKSLRGVGARSRCGRGFGFDNSNLRGVEYSVGEAGERLTPTLFR